MCFHQPSMWALTCRTSYRTLHQSLAVLLLSWIPERWRWSLEGCVWYGSVLFLWCMKGEIFLLTGLMIWLKQKSEIITLSGLIYWRSIFAMLVYFITFLSFKANDTNSRLIAWSGFVFRWSFVEQRYLEKHLRYGAILGLFSCVHPCFHPCSITEFTVPRAVRV